MTEAYISNGKRYNVHQRNLERFLQDHPNAVKEGEAVENLPSKVNENTDVKPENLPADANSIDYALEKYYIQLPNDGGWKSFNVSNKNLEKFKTDYPEARTEQGWKDYSDEQQRKIDSYNKKIKEAKNAQEKKRLEDEKAETERREKLQQQNTDKILNDFNEEYNSRASRTWTKSRNDIIEEGKNFTLDQKIKWLNDNTSNTYKKELSFEEPEVLTRDEKVEKAEEIESQPGFVGPSAIVENPNASFNIFNVETEQPEKAHVSTLGDDYTTKINNYYSDLKELMNNPILTEDGKIDVEATQNALTEMQNSIPSVLTAKISTETISSFETEKEALVDEIIKIQKNSKAYNRDTDAYENVWDGPARLTLRRAQDLIGMSDEEYQRLWDMGGAARENLVNTIGNALKELEGESYLNSPEGQKKLKENQEKIDLYNKGELDLSTEELATISTLTPDFNDYVQRFIPEASEMVALEDPNLTDSENVVNVINSATQKAVQADPKFQFIQDAIIKNVDLLAVDKLEELRNKYSLDKDPTQEGLEAVQKEFTDWYNNSISEQMRNNKDVTRLFQDYGIAVGNKFGEVNQEYLRYKDPSLRKIDKTIARYQYDDSLKGEWKEWSAKIREAAIKLPDTMGTWGNEMQIAVRDFFRSSAEAREDYIDKAIEDLDSPDISFEGESGDLTINEAIKLLGRGHELESWKILTGASGAETLNEALSIEQNKQTELEDDIAIDIEQMLDAYEATAKYRTYDSGKGVLTLEGFLDRVGGLVEQAPHMIPSQLGSLLVGFSTTATVGSGGTATPLTTATAAIGTGLIALGSMVQGAMEYGGTYMDGVRRKLSAELGREPTADEYLEALKSGGYTDQTASLAAGAATVGVEFLSDYMMGKLTGGIGGKIAGSQAGRAILGNTFTRYLASVGVSGFGGMKLNAAQEFLTEGFQEYLGQVADNYIDKYTHGEEFTTVDNIFTSNIRVDEIHEAAKMGYKQGELFGSVALVGTSLGLSQIQQTYEQQAEDIAYKIDMRPGSITYKAADAAFRKLRSKIKDDENLSASEKTAKIEEISRIREAAMKVPPNVTGAQKAKLMNLIIEQNRLKNEIKSEDNAELSVNKIKRKGEVDQQIVDIIESADARSDVFANSVLGPLQKGLEKASGTQFVVDPNEEVSPFAETEQDIDSYQKIDNLIADQDLDLNNRFDQKRILKLAGGTIQAALNRLYQKGGLLTRDQFKTRLENEYIQALTEYNTDKDVNNQGIGQQTSNLFGLRANAVASENIKQQGDTISMSDEKAPQIGDTTEQVDFDAESEQVVGRREKKYMADNTKVTEAVGEEAAGEIDRETSQEILREAGQGKDASSIAKSIANAFGQLTSRGGRGLFKIIGDKVGKLNKGFKDFVDNTVDRDFIAALPAAYLKQSTELQKILGLKKIGKTQVVKTDKDGKKKYSRPSVFAIPSDITDEQVQQVRDYFKKSTTTREGLLKRLSQEFALSSINKLKQNKDFMQKLQTALGDKQNALDFLNEIEGKLDQRTLEDTTRDVSAPKSAIDKLIASLEKTSKDYQNTLMFGISPGGIAKAMASSLKLYKRAIKSGKTHLQAIGDFVKDLIKRLKLDRKESAYVKQQVKSVLRTPADMTQQALDNLIDNFSQKFNVDRGIAYEKVIYKVGRSSQKIIAGWKIEGQQTEKGEGRDFDVRAKIWGFDFNVEAKLEKAIYGSANGIYNFVKNTFDYSPASEKMRNENKSLADKLDSLVKKSKTKLDDFKRIAKALGFDLKKSGVVMDRDTYDNLIRETSTVFGKEKITGDDLAAIYNAKGVYYIQVKGEGLYYLGSNLLGLPVPKFEGTAELSMRIKAGTVKVEGAPNDRRVTIVMDPTNFVRTGTKSNFTIDTEAGISRLMNTPEVELLKQQREATDKNADLAPDILNKKSQNPKKTFLQSLKARIQALKINKKRKGLSAFDMDDTLALTKEKVLYTLPDGKKGELTAGEFAVQYESLLQKGAEFDYSNFDNVDLSTERGPLAGKALERQAKYGSKDIYVVTARPNASQQAIKTFLDSIGLNIPLENIITLEDGSPQAKSDWLLSKAEQGYNDFYFADDSALNVQTVKDILSQIDVKSRVQLAITDKTQRLDTEMNELIEDATDITADQEVTDVQAKLEGKKKDKGFFNRLLRQLTITSSADDFLGLLYPLLGKGEKGTRQQNWIKENLLDPYNKAEQALVSAKMTIAADFAALKKAFPSLKKNALNDEIGVGPYNKSQAIRVYLWNKQGMEIPGMSEADVNALVEAVGNDFELLQFADKIQEIQKNQEYPSPGTNWIAGDIKSDILGSLDTTFRSELMTEFNENADIIFSEKNMNKLEAAFGANYVEALRDSLSRMKRGSNRSTYQGSGSRQVNEMMDWLNASVGVAMFLNMKSGLLQMLSNVNFVNWGDNNIYAASKAFMSRDYVPTVIKLMNSDYLTNRRDGLKINVNEAELAAAANKGGFKGMLSYLLDKGFILTRIFDTLAIATGGATFYINRTNSLLKQTNPETNKLYTKQEAEAKAFDDFYAIAEETQQSSNPSKISSQQASIGGRIILSFQNVTMQYNRKAKKSILDLVNRRRKPGMTQRESDLSNLSSVIYYVGVQNLIFNALQQAVFALAFDEEEEKDRNKSADVVNGMVDSLLFGLGFGGAIISTLKNVGLKIFDEGQKKSPKYQEAAWSLFDISPVIDSKVRNIRTGLKTFSWNMKEIKKRGWSLENPAYLAVSQIVSAVTNIPLDRLMRKMNNISQAFDEETRTYERIALILGWNGWNFGLPYWGRESTIKKEAAEEERLKVEFKKSVEAAKKAGFTKRVPFTGPNSGKPKGLPNVDFVAIKRYDGIIQYYKKP